MLPSFFFDLYVTTPMRPGKRKPTNVESATVEIMLLLGVNCKLATFSMGLKALYMAICIIQIILILDRTFRSGYCPLPAGYISMISSEFTASSTSFSTSRALSDFRILSNLGLVTGCLGRNTVQQSSKGCIEVS